MVSLGVFVGFWAFASLAGILSAYWLGSQPLMESSAWRAIGLSLLTLFVPGWLGFGTFVWIRKKVQARAAIYQLCFLAVAVTSWSFGILLMNFATGFDRFITGGNIVLFCHNRFDSGRCQALLNSGGRAFDELPASTKELLKNSPRLEVKPESPEGP
jgi:hypothetical protein